MSDPQYLDISTKASVGFLRKEFLMKETAGEVNSPTAGNCSADVPGVVAAENWW